MAQADVLIITVILRTAPVMRVMVRTGLVMPVMVRTAPVMAPIQALLRSRLEIGHTILAALAITWAVPITSGARDIGHGATVKGSGSTVTTLLDNGVANYRALDRSLTASG